MPYPHDSRMASHRRSVSTEQSNRRLAKHLAKPPDNTLVIGRREDDECMHGLRVGTHSCLDFENEKRARRGAPPLDNGQRGRQSHLPEEDG